MCVSVIGNNLFVLDFVVFRSHFDLTEKNIQNRSDICFSVGPYAAGNQCPPMQCWAVPPRATAHVFPVQQILYQTEIYHVMKM